MRSRAEDTYDAIVVGAGLSGLTAASLLAKRGLRVAVAEQAAAPGGACGVFKRGDAVFDNGAAMLFGFGQQGFNAHRFVFNCLQEPICVVRHELLYCVQWKGHRIRFFADIDRFAEELAGVFPQQRSAIFRFYHDMRQLYQHVMVETPTYTTPDETDPKTALRSMVRHPLSYLRFLSYLNQSAAWLLRHYFKDPEILSFFDKLTSTYCYTTITESPAVLAAVMFVDNHVGGSYYPAGSTLFVPGKLEKVIEEHGGTMLYRAEVQRLLFENGKAAGVQLAGGRQLFAGNVIYSGTVWNLYEKLIDPALLKKGQRQWARTLVPTYPSVVLYALVNAAVITPDAQPVELLVGNPERLDESEVTVYISSLDDETLCPPGTHVVMAIGPTFGGWAARGSERYQQHKLAEKQRLFAVLEQRFPGFGAAVLTSELATPRTIERYTMKNGGAVAGPKQMLGQHMLRRLHTKSEWPGLYYCGESTVMGTGTPTVTTSGLAAANAILKKQGLAPFVYRPGMPQYVTQLAPPFRRQDLYAGLPAAQREIQLAALCCRYCEVPVCTGALDVPGIMRRVAVGNFTGAARLVSQCETHTALTADFLAVCQQQCIRNRQHKQPVEIAKVVNYVKQKGQVEQHDQPDGL